MGLGFDFTWKSLKVVEPYLYFGARLSDVDPDRTMFSLDSRDNNGNLINDRLNWELGLRFPIQNIPVGSVAFTLGWTRGNYVRAYNTTNGLGAAFVSVAAAF
jgi:hypothetical protein